MFNRIAFGQQARLIPHTDPTDIYFSRTIQHSKEAEEKSRPKEHIKNKNHREESSETGQGCPAPKKMKTKHCPEPPTNVSDYISKHGFEMTNSFPDGNCFFHSLATITGETHQILRKEIVTRMKLQKNVYEDLFTPEIKMKYFIEEESLEERCENMLRDKEWAGFPEKMSAAIFLGLNLFELHYQNQMLYWNVYFGSCTSRILEDNTLKNIHVFYDVTRSHFSPLLRRNNYSENIKISNIYCLLKDESCENGVFINLTPSQLNPRHRMFQNMQYSQRSNQPVGLNNLGLTCYFSSLMQSLFALPIFVNALHIDRIHLENEDKLTAKICDLLNGLSDHMSLNTLEMLTEDVLMKIREIFQNQFLPEHQADPSELLGLLLSVFNDEQRKSKEITMHREFSDLEQTMRDFEASHRSNTTKITTIYTKTVRTLHGTCQTQTFDALPFLNIAFCGFATETIEGMLLKYCRRKPIEVLRCPSCNFQNPPSTEEIYFAHLPEILILSVERWESKLLNSFLTKTFVDTNVTGVNKQQLRSKLL